MAKKTAGPSKSQSIRDYYEANPSAKPAQVAEALQARGIDVSAAFVSTIRSTSKKKKKGAKRGRPPGSTSSTKSAMATKKRGRPPGAASAAASHVSIDSLLKAKQMVESVGSIDEARAALAALEKLLK
jgi:hypothetical protein